MSTLPGFQQYLVDKGFKRTCTEHCGTEIVEDYKSLFLSSYNPLYYNFTKEEYHCYWGLSEMHKPAVMCLGNGKMRVIEELIIQERGHRRTYEDGYRILFSQWKEDRYDEIYDVFISEDKYFIIDCTDEKDIEITVAIT